MYAVNLVLRGLFDALLYPFRTMPALVGVVVVSLITAVAMLIVFKATSNQGAIAATKRKIHASLFEIRLFNDDFRAILKAQLDILRNNLTYLRHSLVPMIFILPPMVLAIAQLQFHYGYEDLEAGQATILEVVLEEAWNESGAVPTSSESGKPRVELELPAGVKQETPPLWIPSERTLAWRLRVEETGDHAIGIRLGDATYDKSLPGPGPIERRSPLRPDRSFLDQLVYPAEPPLPADSPIEAIRIELDPGAVAIGGWNLEEMVGIPAWMLLYFVLSIVFAFALRKPMGVEI